MEDIKKLRIEMYESIKNYGIKSKEALTASEKLDIAIVNFYKHKRGVKNEMQDM